MRNSQTVRSRSYRNERDDRGSERRDYRGRYERGDRRSERREYRDQYVRDDRSSERSDYNKDNNRRAKQRHVDDSEEQYNGGGSRDRYEQEYGVEYGRKRSRYESSKRTPGMCSFLSPSGLCVDDFSFHVS